VIPTSSRYLKKKQIQRTARFGYFRNFKEPPGFMKDPEKTWQFKADIDIFQNFENHGYKYNIWVFDFFDNDGYQL
jgi:hypothetical protein